MNTPQPYKILIAEDDGPIRTMYELKLRGAGFDVATAADGKQGLVLAEQFKPDLLLLDIRMPVMNGHEMLEQLRATDWGAAIRVIVLTNISKDEAPQALRLLHIDRYVVKAHYTPAQIVEVVKEVLGIYH